jgi:phytoene dehydrogenase-like protein
MVVGAGPAGLAAAEALLTEGDGEVEVTLFEMGHHLGGKACSWNDDAGRVVEHGQHVMLGFYEEMRSLLRRAGVDPEATSVSNDGHFTIYEDRDRTAHHLHLGPSTPGTLVDGLRYSGWTLSEKAGFGALFAGALPRVVGGVPEAWDDLCLTAWCLQRGFPVSAVTTNAFRATREAQLNWPGEISAYAMLKTLRIVARDYANAEARFPAGGMTAIWWEPVVARIEDLGGRVVRYHKLTRILHRDGRLRGLEFAIPVPHPPEEPYWKGRIPTIPGTEDRREGVDAAIVTLPPGALAELMEGDPELAALPGLSGVPRLTSVAPLGLHVWHRNRTTPRRHTVVCGLAPPLGFVVDNKRHYPLYRDDPDIGAALHFVGQETCFEEDDDQTLLERALASVRVVPGYERMDLEGVIASRVVRNRTSHRRYWNAEPGSLRHKPKPETPVRGLFLAGDWVRSELDFPCMETAVRSGREAAALALRFLRRERGREAA